MSEPTTVYYDFECLFLNGVSRVWTVQEGRDKIAADEQRVRLEIHQDANTVQEVIIQRSALAYMDTLKRTVPQDDANDAAHGLQLVGGVNAN